MRAYERFLKYVAYPTMSNEESESTPSTEKQWALANFIVSELRALGVPEVTLSDKGYIYASIPANTDRPTNAIGFIAHMDTSSEASDENIQARIVDYKGGDILLNSERGIYMRTSDYPYLEKYSGQELIVTDGTTLLGADDKAGIAEIMTAVEKILASDIPHGKICIGFTPDEEIGRGADFFEVEKFGADYAYTVDGGSLGELEYENFNAASAKVRVNGVSIHPGSAKNKMKNAARIIAEFDAMLPALEIPEATEGYEGFHHLLGISGECELANAAYIIRDHDMQKFLEKKAKFTEVAVALNEKYGEGTVELTLTDSYFNMRSEIEKNPFIVERARESMKSLGITPKTMPIRGGTDGARLSFMGLPCPNLSTGGENFHSRFEFVSIPAMDKMSELIVKIIADAVLAGKTDVIE